MFLMRSTFEIQDYNLVYSLAVELEYFILNSKMLPRSC